VVVHRWLIVLSVDGPNGAITVELLDDVTSALTFDIARCARSSPARTRDKTHGCGSRCRIGTLGEGGALPSAL
jgi:hypothetical protein